VSELGGFKKQHVQDSSGFVEAYLTENEVGCSTVSHYVIMIYRVYMMYTVINIILHDLSSWGHGPLATINPPLE